MPKVLRMPKPRMFIRKRLLDAAELLRDSEAEVTFQHTVVCQTVLPYRDPGDDVRMWAREQGSVGLLLEAGRVRDRAGEWVPVGLPFGPKPRLILAHLNAEAIRTGSPEIEVEDSLTAFVKRLGLTTDGRSIGAVKDQLSRLSAANIRMAVDYAPDRSRQVNTQIISGFDLWLPQDDRQRVLWPSTVALSHAYFESLQRHAVPLDERAIGALSHSAMALDVYAWLAQRLHRIPKPHRQLVPWVSLKDQFGQGYDRIRAFRAVFLVALRQVLVVYEAAKLEVTDKGLVLHTSPPPVAKTGVVVELPPTPG